MIVSEGVFYYLKGGVKNMSYDAIDMAGFVVDTAIDERIPVTNLHLQKILYYLECINLLEKEEPLLNDDVEAWRLGPVYPDVYHEYKVFGSDNIQYIPKVYKIKPNEDGSFKLENYFFSQDLISKTHRDFLLPYIIKLLKKDRFALVRETHTHDPWLKLNSRGGRGLKYDKRELQKYIVDNPGLIERVLK